MADIRVERSKGGKTWLWIVLAAVVVIIAAVLLLDYLGYITLPVRLGVQAAQPVLLAQLAAGATTKLKEA
jgi:hypothetical protein